MKRQFLLTVLLVLAAVFCSTLKNNNSLKACDSNESACVAISKSSEANKTACTVTNKSSFKKMPAIDVEDVDLSFNPFMNPFIDL